MNLELLKEIKAFIREIGFPIGVAVWLLWEAHSSIKDLTSSLVALERTMVVIQTQLR